jgi:hypothetical protein
MTLEADTTEDESSERLAAKARRLANLRPPFQPGKSGNPSGLAKDGLGTKDHPIRATLRARLAKRKALHRLVDTWIDAACDGDSAAREQILKRLDPVIDAETSGRQVVYEGLILEAPNGARAALVQGLVAALGESVSPTVIEASVASEKGDSLSPVDDAVQDSQESRAGGADQCLSATPCVQDVSESPHVVDTPDTQDIEV